MNIARSIARWGLALVIGTCVSLWIFIATINATVANRDVVKSWFAKSGIYTNGLGSLLQVSADNQSSTSLMDLITATTLQQALIKTYDGGYVQQAANTAIDATYDWLEGKTQAISFTIPVQTKAADFSANLAAEIKPKIAILPPCNSRLGNLNSTQISCIPNGISIDEYARQLALPSSDNGFLKAPITQDTITSYLQGRVPDLPWLPLGVSVMHTLMWALPVAIVACGALYVLASNNKLQGLGRVGRQLAVNAGLVLVGGLFLWYAGTSLDLSGASQDVQQAAIITPLIKAIVPDIGRAMSVYSGIIVAVGAGMWVGAYVARRKITHEFEQPLIPPAAPFESELPEPARKSQR